MTEKKPCPFCGSPFGRARGEFMFGCTDPDCPEEPRFHDPVGRPDWVDEFWEDVQQTAPAKKAAKRQQLRELQDLIGQYYQ